MHITKAEFIVSNTNVALCPKDPLPEYAFIGRSNVGKSSLINMLVQRKKLAKTSSTPGKTRLINHFKINGQWFLCDLPGYGYAKVSKKERDTFGKMIEQHATRRTNLVCFFVLVDARHPPPAAGPGFYRVAGRQQPAFCDRTNQVGQDQPDREIQKHGIAEKGTFKDLG